MVLELVTAVVVVELELSVVVVELIGDTVVVVTGRIVVVDDF